MRWTVNSTWTVPPAVAPRWRDVIRDQMARQPHVLDVTTALEVEPDEVDLDQPDITSIAIVVRVRADDAEGAAQVAGAAAGRALTAIDESELGWTATEWLAQPDAREG